MIPVHDFDKERECEQCEKTRYGSFTIKVNGRTLVLCYRCMGNLANIFSEEERETSTAGANGR